MRSQADARRATWPAESPAVQIFDLPAPPSTNALTRNWTDLEKVRGRHKKRVGRPKSERYKTWINAAGWDLKLQKPKPVKGPVRLTIMLSEQSKLDLGNCEKPVTDLLVEHQIIEDDSREFVRAISLIWGDVPGVRVFVEPDPVQRRAV